MTDGATGVSRGHFPAGYVAFAALVSLDLVLILPLTVFRLYRPEFTATLWDVSLYLASAAAAAFAALAVLLKLVPARLRGWVARALLVIVVIAWYNFHFLDYQGRIVGADTKVVDGHYTPYELALFLAAAVAAFAPASLNRHLAAIMAIVCATAGIGLAAQGAAAAPPKARPAGLPPELFSYSPDMNVLHVVLDGMQRVFMDDLIERDPGAAARLDGFWYFPNTLTASEVTYLSFRSFLTGESFTGDRRISEYLATPKRPADAVPPEPPRLLGALGDQGFDLDILSAGGNGLSPGPAYRHFVLNDLTEGASVDRDVMKIVDFTLLRALPWNLKALVYQNGQPYFSSRGTKSRAMHAAEFLDGYASRISTDNPRRTYKMVHVLTPHGPWTSGPSCEELPARESPDAIRDQGRCTMALIVRLVEELARTSVYDRTLILIHGDHGVCLPDGLPAYTDDLPPCVGNANPLLLIKRPGSRGPLEISNRPAMLTDLPRTVARLVDLPVTFGGVELDMTPDSSERPRTFYYFEPDRITAWHRDRVSVVVKHTVTGDVRDGRAWRAERDEIPVD